MPTHPLLVISYFVMFRVMSWIVLLFLLLLSSL